jgi:RNA polymerase sigma-70 factor, ECF subfamily
MKPDTTGPDPLDVWNAERDRLFGIAYRMLGTVTEAEDALSDAWIRWQAAAHATIDEPAAWLTTVVTRRCLDVLRSARVRREAYVGPWLPEPLVTAPDIADQVEHAESLQMALLVVLETLSPLERAVFVLREVFGYEYAEIAAVVGRTEAACRQLAHRARSHVAARRPRFDPDPATRRSVTERFVAACTTGDLDSLVALLAEDVTLWSDGGGVVTAARRPVVGADAVARFLVGIAGKAPDGWAARLLQLNGEPALIVDLAGAPLLAMVLQPDGDRIAGIRVVLNPAKLAALPGPPA